MLFVKTCLSLCLLVCLGGCGADETATPVVEEIPWPTNGWEYAVPEIQGMDSQLLVDMLESVNEAGYNLHSITIVRHGHVVLDTTYYPTGPGSKHNLYSITKSVNAALVGIAIDQGLIGGVDEPILAYFPGRQIGNLDAEKQAMTLQDLLTMQSGLDCRDSYLYDWAGLQEMRAASDWVQHMLDLPMREAPGTRFEYCNGVSYLLAALVQQAAGTTALDFARDNLFSPLGIEEVTWPEGPQGINIGWADLQMNRLDLAKFGYLYLHEGEWDGQQVVSREWVLGSLRARAFPHTLADGYGYQWWVESQYSMGLGYGGQYVVVLPHEDMVVVVTSGLPPEEFFVPQQLLDNYIIPAVQSEGPLPDNPEAAARLLELVEGNAAPPEPRTPGPLPDTAEAISSRRFVFDPNALDLHWFMLEFMEDTASFQLSFGDKDISVGVGLDGVPVLTWSGGYWRAYRGAWTGDMKFEMDYALPDTAESGRWQFIFNDEQVFVQFLEISTGTTLVAAASREEYGNNIWGLR